MSYLKKFLSIGFILILIYSCSTNKKGTKSSANKKNAPATSNSKYKPSSTIKNDLLHTKLELRFDWTKQQVLGVATLRFKPYFYPQNSLELDAKEMDIHKIELNGTYEDLSYAYLNNKISIQLPKTYTNQDTFEIKIHYTAKPNEIKTQGSDAITQDKGLYFINPDGSDKTKPRQIWTQGETEASSCWFPTIDSPNEKTTQEMYITVDTNFVVLTNGEFIYSNLNGDGTKTDYWRMDLPHAPYLFMMAIGEFKIVKDTWREKEVNYYVEPNFEKYARAIFGNTPEMLEFFSTKLDYDYAWNKYSQVVVRDFVSGAMENTTATVFMEALQCDDRKLLDENWDGIIAHELFHHWFGDLVTCESWANLPLNESFANYSEYLWMEYKHGKDEAEYLDIKEAEEYFDEAEEKIEPIIRFHHANKDDMFDRHSYNKGGRILHMLRNYVGDEAFFKSLSLYLKTKAFKTAEVHDLRLAFEEITGEDLNWFFNQWFLAPGHPELKISHKYSEGIVKLTIAQLQDTTKQPLYKLPIKVQVWENDTATTYDITITKAKEVFSFPAVSKPQNIIIDSEFQLLGKIIHTKTKNELIFQYEQATKYKEKADALNNLFAAKNNAAGENPFSDSSVTNVLSKALGDSFWVIRETALLQFSRFKIPKEDEFIKRIALLAQYDPKPAVRARAIALASSYDVQRFVSIYERGLKEKPYSIVSASLRGYLKATGTDKEAQIKIHEGFSNIDIAMVLANHFLSAKDSSRYSWFKEKLTSQTGKDLYYFIGFFGEYVKTLTNQEREDGKKTLLALSESTKQEWIRKMAKKYYKEI